MKKFLVVDGSSLLHRAFFALPPLVNSKGQNTGAVFGLCNMLVRLLAEQEPQYLAVAFDKSRHSFRTDLFADYKGQRKATPPELKEQFPLAMELLAALGIRSLESDDYEADDIIGTLAVRAPEDVEVLIVTGDRDQLQLIDARTRVLFTKRGISDLTVYDRAVFAAEYEGLEPVQLIDLKGLMGDSSDNIPGVAGVGPKTALKLIKQFGSVESVLAHIPEAGTKGLQDKLTEHSAEALLSKRLATIVKDVPLDCNVESYALQPLTAVSKEHLAALEFKNMFDKFAKVLGANGAGDRQEQDGIAVDTLFGENSPSVELEVQDVAGFLQSLPPAVPFKVAEQGRIPNLSFGKADFYYEGQHYLLDGNNSAFLNYLLDGQPKVVADAKPLYRVCLARGIELGQVQDDVALLAYLDNPGGDYEGDLLADYSLLLQSVKAKGMEGLYREIELPLTPILARMELLGLRPNVQKFGELRERLAAQISVLEQRAVEEAGEEFNLKSPKQLGTVLFEKLNLPAPKKTKSGYSTDAKVLESLVSAHPLVGTVLEHRRLTKLMGTYIEGMGALVNPATGRIHTHFQQLVTQTGRLSSTDPNLQNIPTRTEEGKLIRQIFEPGEGYSCFMSCDYSQVELRILAAIAQDEVLLESFAGNEDIHARTAAEVFGVPLAEVTPELRSKAKAVNFGIVYGISDYGLAQQLKVGNKEASGYIHDYLERYQGVAQYMKDVVAEARERGYVKTLLGRRRYLPDLRAKNFNLRSFAERTAINTPIQGTAADIMKLAMLKVARSLKEQGLRSRILLQVHDELLLEVAEEEREKVARVVQQAMESAYDLGTVRLPAEVHFGTNWAAAK